jgi:hypothetical protein
MKKKILITFGSLCLIYLLLLFVVNSKYNSLNDIDVRDSINPISLPIIENNDKYIELQTNNWIEQRKNKKPCFGMLEKDKILMAKWITHFNIPSPKIHYFDYHYNFTTGVLKNIISNNKDKRLVIKISHLQSNYGIIIVEPNEENINKIYEKCQKLIKSCFVCNHDKGNPPTQKEITNGEKQSHYKLYETIEPGIIIQDFFYSFGEGKVKKPIEVKITMFADKIINIWYDENMFSFAGLAILIYKERMKKVFDKAREISELLGAHLIRVDFFVKEEDNPYVPYLNEISLSPNGGMKKNPMISDRLLNTYREEIKFYNKDKKYDYINKLLETDNYRTLAIDNYLSDADSCDIKFKF